MNVRVLPEHRPDIIWKNFEKVIEKEIIRLLRRDNGLSRYEAALIVKRVGTKVLKLYEG